MLDVYHASVAEDANTSLKFAALKELDHYPFSVSHLKIIQELNRNKEENTIAFIRITYHKLDKLMYAEVIQMPKKSKIFRGRN